MTTTAKKKRGLSMSCVARRHRSVQHEIEVTGVTGLGALCRRKEGKFLIVAFRHRRMHHE